MNNRNRKIERGEVFVEVEGFGNRYEISNRGRLWSNIRNRYIGSKDKRGYIHATLCNEEGEQVSTTIHRLVGEAFIPNDDPENKTEINHKNYKTYDNRVENLEWVSRQENLEYSYDNIQEAIKKNWKNPEYREKIKNINSNLMKERRKDPEFNIKMQEAIKKKWEDQEFREKIKNLQSNLMKERNEDPEFQVKRLEGLKKKWEDQEFRERRIEAVIESRRKPVEQYNIDGELVGTYPSVAAAQEATGISSQNICNVLKGRTKTAGGYLWKYKEE